jgi:hypothetical protein
VLKGQQVERRRETRETDGSGAVALNWEMICTLPSVYLFFEMFSFIAQHKVFKETQQVC